MLLFILTREGYEDVRSLVATNVVWVNSGVLSNAEITDLRSRGIDLTCFAHPIDWRDGDQMDNSVDTIAEHHPGERIWMEIRATLDYPLHT